MSNNVLDNIAVTVDTVVTKTVSRLVMLPTNFMESVGYISKGISIAAYETSIVVKKLATIVYQRQSSVLKMEAAANREEANTIKLQQKLDTAKKLAAANSRFLKAKNANSQLKKLMEKEMNSGWESRRPK
jgi:hypothetical protein